MNKTITIATAHSQNFKEGIDNKMEVTLEGGSPYFGYIWINNNIFTITETAGGGYQIKKTRQP